MEMETSLIKIMDDISKKGNTSISHKFKDLIEKASSKQAYIAFCGHFSAGKSTLINALVGTEVLPSSPIPTSANVVSIQKGKPGVTVYFKEKGIRELPLHAINELQDYCRDGDEVSTISVYTETDFLPEGIALLDTPGIDSTDDAHQLATASALHMADIVFYVMDYNHVQSEINFQFAKQLQEMGKPMVMIVNQIDKHNALELSFAQFVNGVQEGFAAWQISPLGMFFISMKDKDHPFNGFEKLKEAMKDLFDQPASWVMPSIREAANHLIDDYGKWRIEQQAEQREEIVKIIADSEGQASEQQKLNALKQEGNLLKAAPEEMEKAFKQEMRPLLENAPIFPYSTTELAAAYIESRKPGFKVGFLFTADKTAKEIERRQKELEEELEKHVTAHILWHMKELLIKLPKQWEVIDPAYEESIRNMAFSWPLEAITKVRDGETSRDYVYRYTQEVGQEIKRYSLTVGLAYLEGAKRILQAKNEPELTRINALQAEVNAVIEAWRQLHSLDDEINQEKSELIRELPHYEMPHLHVQEQDWRANASEQEEKASPILASVRRPLQMEEDTTTVTADIKYVQYQKKLTSEAATLRAVSDIVADVPGFQRIAAQLQARADRMENRQFTVALFGAFSAGKSSLANALLGYPVLPVSPHPTTAVINRIVPVSAERAHGIVHVTIKSKDMMERDVIDACRTVGLQVESLEQALDSVNKLEEVVQHASLKPHVSFLKAFQAGYGHFREKFGQVIETTIEGFSDYVAREDHACFVELVDVFYDCPLTRTGMTLVDTPGADSINARHTGVAFEYIKNADAVLFVTYYNHAFSHADRQFLNQLGRVKDAFEMDKMFFLVNAADLAKSEEELSDVVNHVEDNLVRHGIRKPRIYPVSSQTALWAKLLRAGLLGEEGERQYRNRTAGSTSADLVPPEESLTASGMKAFEESFYSFTLEELTEIAITASHAESARAFKRLEEWIEALQDHKLQRSQKLKELENQQIEALRYIQLAPFKTAEMAIEQETDELAYYIKQRIGFKFNEMFNMAFNGSDLADDGRNMKQALRLCLRDLLNQIQVELSQELRATALRIENHMRKSIKQLSSQWSNEMKAVIGIEELHFEPSSQFNIPSFDERIKDAALEHYAHALSLFKNGKHFFEGAGKNEMKAALEKALQPTLTEEVGSGAELIKNHYSKLLELLVTDMKKDFTLQLEDYCTGLKALYSEGDNESVLVSKKDQLRTLVKEGNE